MVTRNSDYTKKQMLKLLDIPKSRYYDWINRQGLANNHNGRIPKVHWLLPEEKEKILMFCKNRLGDGYRRLTYIMLDKNIVAVSPSSTYRILKEAGLLRRWKKNRKSKGKGFRHPGRAHEHWHVDISHVNIKGTILFLISVLDGFSRYIVHHELRRHMTEFDVELTIQRAKEQFPNESPRIISDNGSQFISKDFKEFIRLSGFSHIRTSVGYPQSNGKLERFHGTIKTEEIRRNSYLSLEDARERIASYIEHYNKVRLHSAIYYLTPEEVLLGWTKARLKERQEKLDKAQDNRIRENKDKKTA